MENSLNTNVKLLHSKVESFLIYNGFFSKKRTAMLTSLIILQEENSKAVVITEIADYSQNFFSTSLILKNFLKFVNKINECAGPDLIEKESKKEEENTMLLKFKCSDFLISNIETDGNHNFYDERFRILSTSNQEQLIDPAITIDPSLQAIIDVTKEISSTSELKIFHPLIVTYLCRIYELLGILNKKLIKELHPLIIENSKGFEKKEEFELWVETLISWTWLLQRIGYTTELHELLEMMKKAIVTKKISEEDFQTILVFYIEMARVYAKEEMKEALMIWNKKIPKLTETLLKPLAINLLSYFPKTKSNDINKEYAHTIFVLGEYLAEFLNDNIVNIGKEKEIFSLGKRFLKILEPLIPIFNNNHKGYSISFGNGLKRFFLLDYGKLEKKSIVTYLVREVLQKEFDEIKLKGSDGTSILFNIVYTSIMPYYYPSPKEIDELILTIPSDPDILPIASQLEILLAKCRSGKRDKLFNNLYKKWFEPLLLTNLNNKEPKRMNKKNQKTIIEFFPHLIEIFSFFPSKEMTNLIINAIKQLDPSIQKLRLLGQFANKLVLNLKYVTDQDYFTYVENQLKDAKNYGNNKAAIKSLLENLYLTIKIYSKTFLLLSNKDYISSKKKLKLLNKMNETFKMEISNYFTNDENLRKDIRSNDEFFYVTNVKGRINIEILLNILRTLQIQENDYSIDNIEFNYY